MVEGAIVSFSERDIIWKVEDIHLREAEFLFGVREAQLDAASYELDSLARGPDRRLIAHLVGLVVGGPLVAERALIPVIENEDEEYEKIAAATLALLFESEQRLCDRAVAILDDAEEEGQRRGVMRGLQLSERLGEEGWLMQTVATASGPGLAARLEVLASHRVFAGTWLPAYLASEDVEVARAAARLARFCPGDRELPGLGQLAQAEDAELRQAALEAALIRQTSGAWESAVYWAFLPGESPFRRAALTWVALLGDAGAHERMLALVDEPAHRADALWALGFSGRVAAVDRCIDLLADEDHGRLAGEVVCAITGLPTDDDRYWQEEPDDDDPEETLPELEDDDLDADLVPEHDRRLRLPEPDEIAAWWEVRRPEFDEALRHRGGRPLDRDSLVASLWTAPMRRRHALAFELAVRSGGVANIETRALSITQQRQLAELGELGRVDCQRGWDTSWT